MRGRAKNPLMNFQIKKRINTELVIDRMAAPLNRRDSDQSDQPVAQVVRGSSILCAEVPS